MPAVSTIPRRSGGRGAAQRAPGRVSTEIGSVHWTTTTDSRETTTASHILVTTDQILVNLNLNGPLNGSVVGSVVVNSPGGPLGTGSARDSSLFSFLALVRLSLGRLRLLSFPLAPSPLASLSPQRLLFYKVPRPRLFQEPTYERRPTERGYLSPVTEGTQGRADRRERVEEL